MWQMKIIFWHALLALTQHSFHTHMIRLSFVLFELPLQGAGWDVSRQVNQWEQKHCWRDARPIADVIFEESSGNFSHTVFTLYKHTVCSLPPRHLIKWSPLQSKEKCSRRHANEIFNFLSYDWSNKVQLQTTEGYLMETTVTVANRFPCISVLVEHIKIVNYLLNLIQPHAINSSIRVSSFDKLRASPVWTNICCQSQTFVTISFLLLVDYFVQAAFLFFNVLCKYCRNKKAETLPALTWYGLSAELCSLQLKKQKWLSKGLLRWRYFTVKRLKAARAWHLSESVP